MSGGVWVPWRNDGIQHSLDFFPSDFPLLSLPPVTLKTATCTVRGCALLVKSALQFSMQVMVMVVVTVIKCVWGELSA